jgi:hypothetical protein
LLGVLLAELRNLLRGSIPIFDLRISHHHRKVAETQVEPREQLEGHQSDDESKLLSEVVAAVMAAPIV